MKHRFLDIDRFVNDIKINIENNTSMLMNFTLVKESGGEINYATYNVYEEIGFKSGGNMLEYNASFGNMFLTISVDELKVILQAIVNDSDYKNVNKHVLGNITDTTNKLLCEQGDYVKIDFGNRYPYIVNYISITFVNYISVDYEPSNNVVSVESVWGEHIITLDLNTSFKIVHEKPIHLNYIETLDFIANVKVIPLEVLEILKEETNAFEMVHLGQYDSWCILDKKEISDLRKSKKHINISVPANDIGKVVGKNGSNIQEIVKKYKLPHVNIVSK